MSLDDVIPPEVSNDSFYSNLQQIARRPELKTFLEIGSSSGAGSTQALVNGILDREMSDAQLFCMELSRLRFLNLVKTYSQYSFVFPYNLSSVSLSDFPPKEEVIEFYQSTKTNLNNYDLSLVIGWLQQDIDYINSKRLDFCGIDFIKSCNQIEKFDFVLIDGSEFTGEAELQRIWGAKVIALDDINAHKCFAAHVRLSNHHAYKLIAQDLKLRNGYAFFERTY
jgi:hypothetical protein